MTYQHQDRRLGGLTATVTDLEVTSQRALLVGVKGFGQENLDSSALSLSELERLTNTAGSEPVETILLNRTYADPASLVGSGQLEELVEISTDLDIDLVVFDNDLTPAQQRNLAQAFECDVVDRTALILEIFAQHATSKSGTLQVELALLQYMLPRLRGKGMELSRLGGGINTRGPGETALEMDRRQIENRISSLKDQLKQVARTRQNQRKSRERSGMPLVALVGYTNAGKSTLMNRLTQAQVLIEDRLFSTLDSTVRKLVLTDGPSILLSDTVGFVRRLPHQLVEAFASTLEEVTQADFILHLVDGSDPDPEGQITAVQEVLTEIGAAEQPQLLVLTKLELTELSTLARLQAAYPDLIAISSVTGEGLEQLEQAMIRQLRELSVFLHLQIPYQNSDITAAAHEFGEVVTEQHDENGTTLSVWVPPNRIAQFTPFRT